MPGKRLWPDPAEPATEFLADQVVAVLEGAAARARAG